MYTQETQTRKSIREFDSRCGFDKCTFSWDRVVAGLCNPGEMVIMDEWTYPSAVGTMQSHGVKPVGVPLDDQGMNPDCLRDLLANWDESARGAPRYTVP